MSEWFRFDGRAGRRAYWQVYLWSTVAGAVTMVVATTVTSAIGPWGAILYAGFLPPILASIAVGVRRAHDRGRGAWWFWLITLGPFLAEVAAENMPPRGALVFAQLALMLAGAVLAIWGLVDLGFRRGPTSPNAFGPAPAR
jgi:uncharacterized membrane protein YhaH (DUF805 family)